MKWAEARIGQTNYDYWCLKFAADAYRSTSRQIPGAEYAKLWWDQRRAAQHVGDMNAPRGAFVFWSWTGTIDGVRRDWGHVGISRGDGTMVTSRFGGVAGIRIVRISDYRTNYLGWIAP